ncbi:MAG: DNA-processing protein DprA [Alphaproteobacteria bacterium]|nr:DNA-processing protein DprA [Alphaproteobacteria bacterium]
MITREEKLARLKLARSESIGASSFWKFLETYGSAIRAIKVISENFSDRIQLCSDEKLNDEIQGMKSIGARFVFSEDELYPPLLRNIPDAPPVLSFLGDKDKVISFYRRRLISVVGSRNSSIHANKFCNILCHDLGIHDAVIVSGLARGIDANAHLGSIDTGTIAVTACGINVVYPQENHTLYNDLIKKGGIFTEMPYDTAPHPQLFPRRNRIIAGMSFGTIVIEAAMQSGSLITAKMALEYGRDVFAVPGCPLDPRCVGSNQLIKDGAILVQSADDVLTHVKEQIILQKTSPELNKPATALKMTEKDQKKLEENILNSLSSVPITIDELISCIKVSPQEVLTVLLELELANKIVRLHGQRVCLALND